ncbi:MAG: ATP-binding protein [Planctomycetota bacterium]
MFRRLFAAFFALLLVSLVIAGVLSARSTRERVLAEMEARLVAEAELLKAVVRAESSPVRLQAALSDLAARSDARFTVIAADGNGLADSLVAPPGTEDYNARQEVSSARRTGRGTEVRYSDTVRYEMMYHAELVEAARADGAVVRVALPLTRVREELGALYRGLAVVFLVAAAAGAGVTWTLARWLTRPLREIRSIAEAIARGDLSRRAPLGGRDEVASVAMAIDRMSEELGSRMASLRAESSKLEAILSSMREGVLAVDRDGGVLHCNREACELFGLSSPPIGLKAWEAIRLPEVQRVVHDVLDGRPEAAIEAEVRARVVSVRVTPVRDRGGAVIVAHDATQEHRYHALRREFVANVSHELRTPLSLVLGYVETLRAGALSDPERAAEFLGTIETHARRLAAIVDDLLDLSRLESGGQALKPRSVDVAALLRRIGDALRPLAEKRRQDLTIDPSPAAGDLVADPDMLERALSNLVDNAIKYTPEGGKIRLSSRADGSKVLFEVEDNGIGIPEADQPRIFERFYRVDKSRSRELGGTGLGLAIVKHVAQLHGGGVSVRSRPGEGTCFTLVLPRPGAVLEHRSHAGA